MDAKTRFAWGMFMSGGYYGLYEDDSSRIGSRAWIAGARRLKVLRGLAEAARFWELSPVDSAGNDYDSLVIQGPAGTNWQVMANPGSRYLAYFWGSKSSTSVRMQIAAAVYTYTWCDARNARAIGSGTVTGGGTVTIPAPSTRRWDQNVGLVLLLRR